MMDGAVSKMHWPSLVLTHTALDDMFHQQPMPQHHTLSHTPRMCSRIRHFINEEKNFEPALLAQESHTRTNTALLGLPARQLGRPST